MMTFLQAAEAVATSEETRMGLWKLFSMGGWLVWPLLALGGETIFIFVERFMAIRKASVLDMNFMNRIRDYISDGKIHTAVNLCKKTDTPIARMIEKGIERIGRPMSDVQTAIENVANLEVSKLENGLPFLATIAGGAPMIGFLGTVLGMVQTFMDMAAAGGTVDLSFPANKATMYTYKVTFSKADLNKASFTVKAKVGSNSPGTNLKWLAAKIAPSERAEVTASGVSGEWVDKNKDDTNVGDFDAYNYRVTVTGATTKVKLTWGSGVELDPFFEANRESGYGQAAVSGNSITCDASPGSEIITFYRKGDSKPTSWEAIGVSCSAA